MATGIRDQAALQRIAAAMRNVQQNWLGLLPRQRVDGIVDAVLAELAAINVTPPAVEVGALPGLDGQFDFGPWTLQVNEQKAIGRVGQDPTPVIAELGDTLTHEARHCEQWFRMARLLVADRRARGMLVDGREVSNRLGIDNAVVCQQASLQPLVHPIERREAEEWYASVYGSNASFREQTFATQLQPTGSGTGQAWQTSQYARYQRALAEEEDAWNTGRELQRIFLAGTGIAPVALQRHVPIRQGISTY